MPSRRLAGNIAFGLSVVPSFMRTGIK